MKYGIISAFKNLSGLLKPNDYETANDIPAENVKDENAVRIRSVNLHHPESADSQGRAVHR